MTVRILRGDVVARLADLPPDHYDCVVTSPPYWGLRDYGVDGQIGLERSLAEHLDVMVKVFAGVMRVLKPSGTLWLNYGDCYATAPNGRSAAETKLSGGDDRTFRDKPFSTVGPVYSPVHESGDRRGANSNKRNADEHAHAGRVVSGGYLKPKDLCMIPNRLAIALQDAGWWVRSEIVWGKPNAMPDSSGRFRPSVSHEKIFLLAKSDDVAFWMARDTGEVSATPDMTERCALITKPDQTGARWVGLGHYYDAEGVRVGRAGDEDSDGYPGSDDGVVRKRSSVGNKRIKMPDGWDTGAGGHGNHHRNGREKGKLGPRLRGCDGKQRGHSRRHDGFNDRWDDMSRAEQQSNGRLLRNYERAFLPVWDMATAAFSDAHFATFPAELVERCLTAGCPKGGRVLDPFGGSGTTGLVAQRMGLDCDLIELNPLYADMAETRLKRGLVRMAYRKPVTDDRQVVLL